MCPPMLSMYRQRYRTCDLGNEEEQGNANGYAKASLLVESKRHHVREYVMTRFEGTGCNG